MNTVPLEFDINTSDADCALGVQVTLDGTVVYDTAHLNEMYHFAHEVSDEDGEHELVIKMYGKLPEHTKLSEHGEILQDALITVSNIQFDSIDVSQVALKQFEYHHDFNGSQAPIVDRFFGSMGCNGQITMKFTTPIYLWLLENM